ncbi:MAG TPA: PAS domain-containing sensor histidine kinase, partial [Bacillota bacterium]|nr:PAS domain-containing sensor histidine kinase [Bacillota bacterium]
NRTLERIMGVPRGGWRGKTDYELLPKERAEYYCREDRRILQDCVCRQVEEEVRMPDGQVHIFLANKFPLLDPQGQPYALCGISVNITERKQMEQQLRQVSDELARSNHQLEQAVQERTADLREAVQELHRFSYALMHDMRAPLRAMHSFVSVIQQNCAGCEQRQVFDFLGRIQAAAERMDALIRDSLDYAKAVQHHVRLSPVDLGRLLRGLIESYPNLQAPGAEIQLLEPLPRVVGNEAALTQCFANLLGNAVKFVAVGTRPQVQVRAEPREGCWRVWVEDNGIGICPEDQERIFEMFQRLDQGNYEGTGIGLAIVRKTVERMGGRLGVESEPGKGSRFWVELKRVEL